MSADNGIYILNTKNNEYRVAYASAIDNFDYYMSNDLEGLTEYVLSIWGKSSVFYTVADAIDCASKMERNVGHTEYGICTISVKHYPFPSHDSED